MLKCITNSESILYLGENCHNEYYQFILEEKNHEIIKFMVKELEKKPLPEDLVTREEIQDFIAKLKIYHSQPSESDMNDIAKDKLLRSHPFANDIGDLFNSIHSEVVKWWKNDQVNFLDEKFEINYPSSKTPILFGFQPPVAAFVGRKDYLIEIIEKFKMCATNSTKIIIISHESNDVEGLGKSELAKHYIDQHLSCYEAIFWINASSITTLNQSFHNLAENFAITTTNNDGSTIDLEDIVSEILTVFKSKKCLFVYDDVENEKLFSEILLRCKHLENVNNLITSRNKEWSDVSTVILIEPLKDDEAISFLKNEIKEEEAECLKLIRKIGGCPGDLKLAVDYINDQRQMGDFAINEYTTSDGLAWKSREED